MVYWNTACLRVDAGLGEEATTSYEKIAKAVGNMIAQGVEVAPLDINKSGYMFEPDEKHNRILYGFKAMNGAGGELTSEIISHRPYNSIQEVEDKVAGINKTTMLSLIKSGAFDCFGEREHIMREYLTEVSAPKKRLTLQNFNGLVERGLWPSSLDFCRRLFLFNKALRANKKAKDHYVINYNYYDFYSQFFDLDLLEPLEGTTAIPQKTWQKLYTKAMEPAKKYIQENQQQLLDAYNQALLQEQWEKYAQGTFSTWEMESLGYYYHEHELANVRGEWYDIVEYKDLPEEPEVECTFRRNGRDIPIYKTCRIMGTVIGKNISKGTINLLTVGSGVVTVKFPLDYFAKYNRRISEDVIENGKRVSKVREQGFFQKGTLVIINGFKRSGMFVSKRYKKTASHQLYKITNVNPDGSIAFTNARWGEEEQEI